MNSRLQQFLDLENLTPARLSDIIGVQRSGLSHILSGRNKPSFDFIRRILVKFPRINAEWLITGKGKPYKDFEQTPPSTLLNNPGEKNLSGQNSNNYENSRSHQNFGTPENFDEPICSNEDKNWDFTDNFDNEEATHTDSQNHQTYPNNTQQADNVNIIAKNTIQQLNENCVNGLKVKDNRQKKSVKRVIIFYNDGSFEELFPRMR